MKKTNGSRTNRRTRILAWFLALTLMVPWNAIAMAAENAGGQAENAGAQQTEVNVISSNGAVINVPVDDEIQGSGDIGTVFSPAELLGPYTVSFYQQDPESEDAPENNLIAEYKEVAYDTELSEEIDSLQSEYPQYIGVEWNLAGNYKVTNNLEVWAINADTAASIGEKEYPTLQAAINALDTPDVKGTEIVLSKDVQENVSVSDKEFTLDMDGHTLTSKEDGKSVFTINGGIVTLKNGTITGANLTDRKNGGGISAENSNVTLEGMTIKKNAVEYGIGGGIYLNNSTLTAENTVISENSMTGGGVGGGGVGTKQNSICTVTFKPGCIVENNYAQGKGGGVYFAGGTFNAEGLIISGNTSKAGAAGLQLSGTNNSSKKVDATLTNVQFTGNQYIGTSTTNVADALLVSSGNLKYATGCTFTGNNGSAPVIWIQNSGNGIFNGCTISDNTLTNGSTIVVQNETIFTDCRIEHNTAQGEKSAGGLELYGGEAELTNTVITDNIGGITGGIYVKNSAGGLEITGNSAVYNNGSSNAETNGNDLCIALNKASNVTIPGASKMVDDDSEQNFSEYCWNDTYNDCTFEGDYLGNDLMAAYEERGDLSDSFYLTAGPKQRFVAQILEKKYETVSAAVADALPNGEIRVIAGDEDNTGNTVTESVEIPEDKIITLILGAEGREHTLKGKPGIAITVNGGTLKLSGKGSVLERISSAYAIVNKGSLTIDEEVNTPSVDHQSGELTLNGITQVQKVKLSINPDDASGTHISANAGFDINENMTIVLADKVIEKLNSTEDTDKNYQVTLIEGDNLDGSLADKITLVGEGSLKPNGLVTIEKIPAGSETDSKDKIVATKLELTGVFLDGQKGEDPSNGEESDRGLTPEKPVRTFEAAKKILENWDKNYPESPAEGIYVTGTVEISGNKTWSLEGTKGTLMRYPLFEGALVEIKSGNTLTLNNITIDGKGDLLKVSSALINVAGGALEIGDEAKLINNDRTQSENYGGAVYADNNARITMSGGEISGNCAWHGAGICLLGGSFTMSGGEITGNKAEGKDCAGGGVTLGNGAQMTMEGGEISNNSSAYIAGGISVGGAVTGAIGNGGANLAMTKGTISGNIAAAEGGGIYVQSKNSADISGGSIIGNESHGGYFGGGGIYVNGPRTIGSDTYPSAVLTLHCAEVTGNSVTGDVNRGGGYAGCGTSVTNIEPRSAAIYNNTASGTPNDVLLEVLPLLGETSVPKFQISGFMYDGTPYHWKGKVGRPVSSEEVSASAYQDSETSLETVLWTLDDYVNLYTEERPTEGGSVIISGNTSATRGGGIGNNGTVVFAGDESTTEVSVTKTWDDIGYSGMRPSEITVELLRDGIQVERQIIKKQGNWPTFTFKNLPADGNYSVREITPEHYSSECSCTVKKQATENNR